MQRESKVLIALFSSNRERDSEVVKAPSKVNLTDTQSESLKTLVEKKHLKGQSKHKPSQGGVKEAGKKFRDNRVGSFMRATTPPVVSEATSRSFNNESTVKPPITNIDDLPIRGFNGLGSSNDVAPQKTKSQSTKKQISSDDLIGHIIIRSQEQPLDEVSILSSNDGSDTKSPEKFTTVESNSTKRQSPLHIGTLESSPRQPGRNQSGAVLFDGQKRLVSDLSIKHSLSYESLQSNQSGGICGLGEPNQDCIKETCNPIGR